MDISKIQLHNINLKEFLDAIDHCKGDVFLETEEGDSLNLKSKLCQIIGLSSILSNPEIGMFSPTELFVISYDPSFQLSLYRFSIKVFTTTGSADPTGAPTSR